MTTRQLATDIMQVLVPPAVADAIKRCAAAAREAGATPEQVAAVLAVPIEPAAAPGGPE